MRYASIMLTDLKLISPRCYTAKLMDGRKIRIPVSQLAGIDKDYKFGSYYWVASWLVRKEGIQPRKQCVFDDSMKRRKAQTITQVIKPFPVAPVESNVIKSLKR